MPGIDVLDAHAVRFVQRDLVARAASREVPSDQLAEFGQRVPVELAALDQGEQIAGFVARSAARVDDDARALDRQLVQLPARERIRSGSVDVLARLEPFTEQNRVRCFGDDVDYVDAVHGFGRACNGFHLYAETGAHRRAEIARFLGFAAVDLGGGNLADRAHGFELANRLFARAYHADSRSVFARHVFRRDAARSPRAHHAEMARLYHCDEV